MHIETPPNDVEEGLRGSGCFTGVGSDLSARLPEATGVFATPPQGGAAGPSELQGDSHR